MDACGHVGSHIGKQLLCLGRQAFELAANAEQFSS